MMIFLMRFQVLWLWLGLFIVGCGGSSSGGGGGGGAIDTSDSADSFVSLHDNPEWTFVKVDGTKPYGTKTIKVPAKQHWVNTGVFLKKNDEVTLEATGKWSYKSDESFTAAGDNRVDRKSINECNMGALVGRINLNVNDKTFICLGESVTFKAPKTGILFIGMNPSKGEHIMIKFRLRSKYSGALEVKVTAKNANTVPLVEYPDLTTFDYDAVESGWVELATRTIVLTVPTALAIKDKADLAAALQRLQGFYNAYFSLRQRHAFGTNKHPEPVRFIVDPKVPNKGTGLGANPIRISSESINLDNAHRITQVGSSKNSDYWWKYANELGRTFQYQPDLKIFIFDDAWSKVFAVHAQRSMKLDKYSMDCATRKSNYLKSTTTPKVQIDEWLGSCFLIEFYDKYGFEFYKKFYKNVDDKAIELGLYKLNQLREDFVTAGDEDVNTIFEEWKLPVESKAADSTPNP